MDGEITGSDYTELKQKINSKITSLRLKSNELKHKNDNFYNELLKGIDILSSLGNIYDASDIEGRQRIIGSIFPRNFIFEENKVRTDEINEVVRWIIKSTRALQQKNSGQLLKNSKLSALVAGARFELTTFGL